MEKRFLVLFLAFLMLISFVSCNNGDGEETKNTEVEAETDKATETSEVSAEEYSESVSESETEKEETIVDNVKLISPAPGATVVLANDTVYDWWKEFHWVKTDSTPFYTHEDTYKPVPVVFEWEEMFDVEYYVLYIAKNAEMTDSDSYVVNEWFYTLDNLFVGTDYYWRVDAVCAVFAERVLVVKQIQRQPRLVFLTGMGAVFEAGHETGAPHVGRGEREVAAFVDDMEIGLGVEAAEQTAVAHVGQKQAGLPRGLGGQHHERKVHHRHVEDVQRGMLQRGVAVDLNGSVVGRNRPCGAVAVAHGDLGVLELVAVAEQLVHLRTRNVQVRPGNEDGAVLEPAGTGIQIEFGFSGVQHVAPHAGLDIALHEDPVGSRVVAGEIGLHVVVAALEQDAARSFHDDAVVDALQLIGLEVPRQFALGADGSLRIGEPEGSRGRRRTEATQNCGQSQDGTPHKRRISYMKKHGISRLQDRKREGKGIGQR